MIRPAELESIRAGEVDLAFRRWERPRVLVGSRLRTAVGLVEVTSVESVAERSLTAEQARRAGAPSLEALRHGLARHAERPVFRIGLRYAGPDPRHAMRDEVPDEAETAALLAWLDRLDRASSVGPWTRAVLQLIDELPATRAPELAARLGRDTPSFKRDVRKLKDRGLSESLDIGYRLSARGAAVLDHGGPPRERPPSEPGAALPRIGAAASRALTARGLTRLEQLTAVTAGELAALHGVGPFALRVLTSAMDEAGLSFLPEPSPER